MNTVRMNLFEVGWWFFCQLLHFIDHKK